MSLTLAGGGWQAELLPHLGGSLASARLRGVDVLRPAPAGVSSVLDTACFPLVPFANRIAGGRFRSGGQEVRLPVLPAFAPHAIHGVGWRRAWRVAEASKNAASLSLEAGGDEDWPWRFEAEQKISVGPQGLSITLSVVNRDLRPMPAGLGLHPCFPAGDGTRLKFAASGVWLSDATLIPVRHAPPGEVEDFAQGAVLPRPGLVDHCYTGWNGQAELTGRGAGVTIRADTGMVHIFAPPEGGYCCVEPVTQRPDAAHPLTGESKIRPLPPGECLRINLCIEAKHF